MTQSRLPRLGDDCAVPASAPSSGLALEVARLTRQQKLTFLAAWIAWGFDMYDGVLFTLAAPVCVPALVPGARDAGSNSAVLFWTGALTSVLLLGWAIGGMAFGRIADRHGRARTLLATIVLYAVGTLACAVAPNMPAFIVCRFVASLGIGGEWAAGAALVAETMPERRRIQMGALLYTAAPVGLFLASVVNDLFTHRIASIAAHPDLSWRLVFATGIVPAAFALWLRRLVKEPQRWSAASRSASWTELFAPQLRWRTLGGLTLAVVALVTVWNCLAFIPVVAHDLAAQGSSVRGSELAGIERRIVQSFGVYYNVGGLLGTLLTVPLANRLGRRTMFVGYFAGGALAIVSTFGLALSPNARALMFGLCGLTTFGVFGSFTFYLPELFPTRLRGFGTGFCYNAGRLVTAAGPFLVGAVAQSALDPLHVTRWVALAPATGAVLVVLGLGTETRGQALP
jgi:MFS family permease